MSAKSPRAGYIYIWEYRVRPEKVGEFEEVYGSGGPWVDLFQGAAGYVKTELHRDRVQPYRYVTIDYWESVGAWESFRAEKSVEFDALDSRCGELTLEEREIGRFESPGRAG